MTSLRPISAKPALYTLRPATSDDLPFLYELVCATMRAHVEETYGAWDEAWQRERFDAKFAPERWRVILVGDLPVGGVAAETRPDVAFLSNLHLLPAYQGRGIGTSVVQLLQADAAARDLPVTLNVLRSNHRAKQWYERLGFCVVTEEEARWWMEWTA